MLENVVVGVDEAPTAEVPLRRAIDLVKSTGGTLHLVNAYKSEYQAPPRLPRELRYATPSTCHADQLLEGLAKVAAAEHVPVVVHPVTADPVDAITKVAEQEHADLIVVGHRQGGRVHHLHRSVSNLLARRAPCAVMIVPTA